MIKIEYRDGENSVLNSAGRQLRGAPRAEQATGLNPKELLEAALGLCVSLTLTSLLERDGLSVGDAGIDVEVTASKQEDVKNRFTDFTIAVRLPELEPDYKAKLLLMAERGCTIGNTLKTPPSIEIVEMV